MGRMSKTVYSLKLGDGCNWLITATPSTRSWVEKFATIMKLKADEQDRDSNWPRLLFFLKNSGKDGHLQPINLMGSKIKEELPRCGWKAHDLGVVRFWSHRSVPDIICEIGNEGNHELDVVRMWTSLFFIYLRVQDSGGLPLHAALIERKGRGVLLAGPGGSGKTTACSRLPRSWSALSEDQTVIVNDDRKTYLAHPFPTWSDYLLGRSERKWNVEHSVPLTAIFYVEKAGSDEVIPIGQEQAAVFINSSSTEVHRTIWSNLGSHEEERKVRRKIFENSCELARAIPAYMARISLTGRFWEEMEKVL